MNFGKIKSIGILNFLYEIYLLLLLLSKLDSTWIPHAQNNISKDNFKLQTIRQELTGPPYEEMYGKSYVYRNGSLRTITWKDDDDYYYYYYYYY